MIISVAIFNEASYQEGRGRLREDRVGGYFKIWRQALSNFLFLFLDVAISNEATENRFRSLGIDSRFSRLRLLLKNSGADRSARSRP